MRGTTCLPCDYPCLTCLESDFCYSCGWDLDNRRYKEPSCKCNYLYHDNGKRCVLCTDPCRTCESEANTDCYSCIHGYYLDGEVGTMAECKDCKKGCKVCEA